MLERFWRLLFPLRCPFCGAVLPSGAQCCSSCATRLPYFTQAIPIASDGAEPIMSCAAPFRYEDIVRKSILQLKFHGKRGYAGPLSFYMAQAAGEVFADIHFDIVTSVPLTRVKERERGYNQAALLAKETARRMGAPYAALLQKVKSNEQQHNLPAHLRWRNVQGVYAVRPGSSLQGKRVLLCDDVVTTGATLGQCASVLLASGAAQVNGLVVAAALRKG